MTTTGTTRPPKPEISGSGLEYRPVPDPEWRVAADGVTCRHHSGSTIACGEPAVAEEPHPADPISQWWPYCGGHARRYGRWAEDGKVLRWALRRPDGTEPTRKEKTSALNRRGTATECREHHVPRSQCPPTSRHPRTNRYRDDTYKHAEHAAAAQGVSVNEWAERVAEAALGSVTCRRGSCPEKTPPVPVEFGDLAGKTFGEWAAVAAELVEGQHPRHQPVTVGANAPPAPLPLPSAVPFRSPAVTR